MADSSPASHGGLPLEEILTPRTKVARMLADIDEEIENAPTPSPIARHGSKVSESGPVTHAMSESPLQPASSSNPWPITKHVPAEASSHSASGSSDSEGSIRRPQGRAARRMLLNKRAPSQSYPSSPVQGSSPPTKAASRTLDDEEDLYSATPMKPSNRSKVSSRSPTEDVNEGTLFVSPAKTIHEDSEDDLPSNPIGGKLAELVAQKRAERLAREAEEKARKKIASSAQPSSDLPEEAFEGSQEPVDPEIERIMSDATRPSRKASKKALLEMERETQRIARQQALAHQMKVKKKFTTQDLFARFNFRQNNASTDPPQEATADGEITASSVPNSDGSEERAKEPVSTPPSSPPTPLDRQKGLVERGALSKLVPIRQDSIASLIEIGDANEELPDLADIVKSSQLPSDTAALQTTNAPQDRKSLKLAQMGEALITHHDSSDDELDILPRLPPHLRVFENAANSRGSGRPADSRAIQRLKHLSGYHADDSRQQKKGSRPSVNPLTLDSQLRRHAKQQARQQELERIEELRAKGIEVQTTEDREKEAEAYEDLLEKARQDAVKLREAEKAAKRAANGENAIQASDDEDEDEDYDYDGSGSEDEDGSEVNKMDKDGDLIDDAAEETTEDEEEAEDDTDEEHDHVDATDPSPMEEDLATEEPQASDLRFTTPVTAFRNVRKSRIVLDEEDEDEDAAPPHQDKEHGPAEGDDDPFAAFNFGPAGNASLLFSPTQAFNATMQTPTQITQEDSFEILRRIAPPSVSSLRPTLPDMDALADESIGNGAEESQVPESQRVDLQWETQPPATPVPANLHRDISGLSETPGWEPSQDPGLPSPWGLQTRRDDSLDFDADHNTQSTVRLRISESPPSSQAAPRRGRLVRRQLATAEDSEDDDAVDAVTKVTANKKDAFREMARRRKDAMTATERAEADKEMRGMMDEQAEESEDEYAGLGGDDYVAPETEEDKEMIDSSHIDVDERAIAAHFAERQRIRDEEETSRLYKDVTTGVLRRKMGANAFDLEEDEDEMAARRRQMRQQEEARKRKALLKDVNVATLAEGRQSKGKDAFLRAIADDDGDEDVANTFDGDDESGPATEENSQLSQSQPTAPVALVETSGNKRRLAPEDEADDTARPFKQRRTEAAAFRRPTSLMEVKQSVSFLLEEPNAAAAFELANAEYNSDSEGDDRDDLSRVESEEDEYVAAEEGRQNDGGFAPNPANMEAKIMPPRLPAVQRRTNAKPTVVDRLSLKRSSSTTDSAHSRTAWAAGPTTGGFKVPSLMRRATTNNTSGNNDRGVTTPAVSREHSGVKMGGTKKSSLAYQARAEERRAIVEASARRREENTARIAQLRRNSSALNRGLTGRFE